MKKECKQQPCAPAARSVHAPCCKAACVHQVLVPAVSCTFVSEESVGTSMKEEGDLEIRFARMDDWETAMGLAWKTFLEFEAKDYAPEGVRSFEDFITDTGLKRMFQAGDYRMMVAWAEGRLVGMITLRDKTHISLLFVEKSCHRHGIGRALIREMSDYAKRESGAYRLTVNASPYGVPFYHKIGFKDLGPQQRQDGIIYTPMEYVLSGG